MKAILFLTLVELGLMGKFAVADEIQKSREDAKPRQLEKLGLVNSQSVRMSDEEADAAKRQAAGNFSKQIEMSDPEAKAALLKAQRELESKRLKKQNRTSN